MAKVLKYIGKGQWLNVDEKDILPTDKTQKAKKTKLSASEKLDQFFETVKKDIISNGYRSIKVSTFLKNFSIEKRTAKNVETVKTELKIRGFYTLPEYSQELKLDSTLRIYNYPVRQLGDLFATEKHLEDYVDKLEHYKSLGIKSVVRQHSPKGSKDKLDFKGDSSTDEIVVLELKNAGGGKSAVEQVLRYSGLLKMEFADKKVRQILVTGVQNYETALAIRGMQKEQRDLFEWYLYKYHKNINHFEFVKVTDNDIDFTS
jgi:Endonuclease NucS